MAKIFVHFGILEDVYDKNTGRNTVPVCVIREPDDNRLYEYPFFGKAGERLDKAQPEKLIGKMVQCWVNAYPNDKGYLNVTGSSLRPFKQSWDSDSNKRESRSRGRSRAPSRETQPEEVNNNVADDDIPF